MTPATFTTKPLPPEDQFEAWRQWYEPVFDVTAGQPSSDVFQAETRLWMLGGLAMSRTIASSVHVVRSRRHVRREPVDHWVISYCARGAHFARTADIDVEVPSGVPYLWSLGQEFLHERTHVDRVQFLLARDAFRDLAPVLDGALGTTLDTPLGRLLGDYMIALERRLTAVTEEHFPRLSSAVGTMVAAAVAPSQERLAVAKNQIDLGRKERVRRAVRRHLRTPTLGPRTLGVGSSGCPARISIGCSRTLAAWPDIFSASDCWRRMPPCLIPHRRSTSRRLPRTSASPILPPSAGCSNGSSATAPPSCGRLHWPGWHPARPYRAARYRIGRISGDSSGAFSDRSARYIGVPFTTRFLRCWVVSGARRTSTAANGELLALSSSRNPIPDSWASSKEMRSLSS